MEPRTFLDALHDAAGDTLLATVLEGEAPGAQLLLRGGVPLWPEHPAPCLSGRLPALRQITSSGVQELEGLRVFAERFGAAPRLVVCGGGHVGASVVRLARLLGLPVCALEDRPDFADDLRDAGAEEVLCAPFSESLAKISGGAECYFVVVTRAHNCDLECLTAILQKPAAYVGMMGSRGRTALVRRQLTEAGLDPARVEALHAPIGLAIGAKTAEEIALSILAEIVQIKSARPPRAFPRRFWQRWGRWIRPPSLPPSFRATDRPPAKSAPKCCFCPMAGPSAAWAAASWNTGCSSLLQKCWRGRNRPRSLPPLPRTAPARTPPLQPAAAR